MLVQCDCGGRLETLLKGKNYRVFQCWKCTRKKIKIKGQRELVKYNDLVHQDIELFLEIMQRILTEEQK